MRSHSSSPYWLPLLLVVGGLVGAGCGASAPVVQSVGGPDTLETNESGTFKASINEEADEPVTYTWNFGDGSSGSGLLADHSYSSTGRYSIRFRARNENGSDTDTISVTVVPPPQPASIASISATPNPVDEDKTVRFTSNVQGERPLSRNWSFGDGTSTTGRSPTHTYQEPGEYTVRLQASNDVGGNTRTVTVRVRRALPDVCTTINDLSAAFFERNSSTLTDDARGSLRENAALLSKCPNITVRIEGYVAPNERNQQSLSKDRAEAVASYYKDNGVPGDRLLTTGQGQAEAPSTEKGDARQYRRVDSVPELEGEGM